MGLSVNLCYKFHTKQLKKEFEAQSDKIYCIFNKYIWYSNKSDIIKTKPFNSVIFLFDRDILMQDVKKFINKIKKIDKDYFLLNLISR